MGLEKVSRILRSECRGLRRSDCPPTAVFPRCADFPVLLEALLKSAKVISELNQINAPISRVARSRNCIPSVTSWVKGGVGGERLSRINRLAHGNKKRHTYMVEQSLECRTRNAVHPQSLSTMADSTTKTCHLFRATHPEPRWKLQFPKQEGAQTHITKAMVGLSLWADLPAEALPHPGHSPSAGAGFWHHWWPPPPLGARLGPCSWRGTPQVPEPFRDHTRS